MAAGRGRSGCLAVAAVAVSAAILAPAADATFPGRGGEILFHKSGPKHGTWAVDSRSGELRRLTKSFYAQEAQWGPDGETVVLSDEEDIVVLRDGDRESITQTPRIGEHGPTFSGPAGGLIAFWAYNRKRPESSGSQIWVMNADGSNRRRLTPGGDHLLDHNPSFSPDGSQIAFDRAKRGGHGGTRVCVMRLDGSRQKCFAGPGDSYAPSFSPSGNSIVFTRLAKFGGESGHTRVARRRLETGKTRYVTPAFLDATDPVFSPSGYRIAYITHNPRTGADVIQATNLQGDKRPRVTPKRFRARLNGPLSWSAE